MITDSEVIQAGDTSTTGEVTAQDSGYKALLTKPRAAISGSSAASA